MSGLTWVGSVLRSRGAVPGIVMLAILVSYLLLASRTTLWDRDEPRFARAAVEMLESGNYMVITFNGETWPDKPVMTYWLMALAIRVLGPTELACRLFGIVGTALTCGLTFCIGRGLLGRAVGLWAMLILASTLQMLVIGGAATSDAVLLPFTVGAMAVFAMTWQREIRPVHMIAIGLATGMAMLIKGPMGLMPALAIATISLLGRKDRKVRFVLVGVSVIMGTLIFCAWAVPASGATQGEFLRVFIGRHVIGRAIKPMEHHGGNFFLYLPYYLPVVMAGFFPWTLHLPGALSALLHAKVGGESGRRLLLGWTIPPFVVMSLAATKLPHYIVFIWPALALMVGGVIVAAKSGVLTAKDRDWLRGGVWFFGPIAGGLGLGLIVGPWFMPIPGLRAGGAAAGTVVLSMAALAIRRHLEDQPQKSALILIVGMIVLQVPLQIGVLPALERIKISPALARAVNAHTSRDVPVAVYKYGEPTLNFYLGRQIQYLSDPEGVLAWAAQTAPGVLIIPRDRLDQIRGQSSDLPVKELAAIEGFNYSKGKKLEVLVLSRYRGEP